MRVAAQLAVRGRADWAAATAAGVGTAFLEGQQLLGTESLVVDLRRSLDQILQMRSQEEVSQVDEFAVVLVLDVDDAPSVLATADLLAIDNDGLLGTDDGEGDKVL